MCSRMDCQISMATVEKLCPHQCVPHRRGAACGRGAPQKLASTASVPPAALGTPAAPRGTCRKDAQESNGCEIVQQSAYS